MGGNPPSDLLLPMEYLQELSKNPDGFILAIPLAPEYTFTTEDLIKMEGIMKNSPGLNRTTRGSVVIWTPSVAKGESIWTAGRAVETITPGSAPFIMGGKGCFWPLPLQRQGACTTVMWKVSTPEPYTSSWLDYAGRKITKEWKGLFWTLSKRYDLLTALIAISKSNQMDL